MKPGPDVLLVGPRADADSRALGNAGVTAEIVDNCLQAILRLEQARSPLVVLSSRSLDGRDEAAIRALRETTCHPRVLLTVPPDRFPTPAAWGATGMEEPLPEPYFPEDLVARVERILDQAGVESGAAPAGPGDTLGTWLTDLAQLHGSVEELPVVCENIATIFRRQARVEVVEVFLPATPESPPERMAVSGAHSRLPHRVGGLEAGPGALALERGEPAAADRVLALPLLLSSGVRGVVMLTGPIGKPTFTERDVQQLRPLTEQVTHAVSIALKIRHLTDLSTIDELTGLYNLRFFRRALIREFRRAERYDRPLSLAIIDLDHFKVFNDCNGHEAGNRCLRQLGEILSTSFRDTDIVCRYGGEEFAIILPELHRGKPGDGSGAWRVLERLRARIQATPFPGEENLPLKSVTISCGVAAAPEDAHDAETLLEAADQALYQAKGTGRNWVAVPAGLPPEEAEEEEEER